jgi:hypothetical protein
MGACVSRDCQRHAVEDLDTEIMQRLGHLGYHNKEVIPVVN